MYMTLAMSATNFVTGWQRPPGHIRSWLACCPAVALQFFRGSEAFTLYGAGPQAAQKFEVNYHTGREAL
jgi:hypothetical protein